MTVKGINNAAGVKTLRDRTHKLKFMNVRAASWWKLREDLDPNLGDSLAIPPSQETLAELCSSHYKVGAGGIQIESKDDVKERLGRSPDIADAIVLAHWQPTWSIQGLRTLTLRIGNKRIARDIYCCAHNEIDFEPDPVNTLVICIHTRESTDNLDQCENPIDRIHIFFPDLDPKDYRTRWNEPLPEFDNKTALEAMISPTTAKHFVQEINKERARRWLHLLIVDDTDGKRATSAACAAADIMGIPRGNVWWPNRDDEINATKLEPPNDAIYQALKSARASLCA